MGVSSAAELLNLMGVLTGAALCAMLLALVLRGRAGGDRDDCLAAADGACSAWSGTSASWPTTC